ncbi:hypothetical protein [Nostoc sp.]|uniref:hypothetical protein n=1 Tax=Nostoc sp. TaxID=1180 RepID=UPI002FFBBB52
MGRVGSGERGRGAGEEVAPSLSTLHPMPNTTLGEGAPTATAPSSVRVASRREAEMLSTSAPCPNPQFPIPNSL